MPRRRWLASVAVGTGLYKLELALGGSLWPLGDRQHCAVTESLAELPLRVCAV